MKKSLITVALTGALLVGFSGCGSEEKSTSNGGSSTTEKYTVKITQDTYADNIKIEWSRSGKALKGIYTQLELENTRDRFVIATTNSDNKITINCVKNIGTSNGVKYKCKADNVTYSRTIEITDTGSNDLQEKAGVKSNDSTIRVAKMHLNSDASYTVSYVNINNYR